MRFATKRQNQTIAQCRVIIQAEPMLRRHVDLTVAGANEDQCTGALNGAEQATECLIQFEQMPNAGVTTGSVMMAQAIEFGPVGIKVPAASCLLPPVFKAASDGRQRRTIVADPVDRSCKFGARYQRKACLIEFLPPPSCGQSILIVRD